MGNNIDGGIVKSLIDLESKMAFIARDAVFYGGDVWLKRRFPGEFQDALIYKIRDVVNKWFFEENKSLNNVNVKMWDELVEKSFTYENYPLEDYFSNIYSILYYLMKRNIVTGDSWGGYFVIGNKLLGVYVDYIIRTIGKNSHDFYNKFYEFLNKSPKEIKYSFYMGDMEVGIEDVWLDIDEILEKVCSARPKLLGSEGKEHFESYFSTLSQYYSGLKEKLGDASGDILIQLEKAFESLYLRPAKIYVNSRVNINSVLFFMGLAYTLNIDGVYSNKDKIKDICIDTLMMELPLYNSSEEVKKNLVGFIKGRLNKIKENLDEKWSEKLEEIFNVNELSNVINKNKFALLNVENQNQFKLKSEGDLFREANFKIAALYVKEVKEDRDKNIDDQVDKIVEIIRELLLNYVRDRSDNPLLVGLLRKGTTWLKLLLTNDQMVPFMSDSSLYNYLLFYPAINGAKNDKLRLLDKVDTIFLFDDLIRQGYKMIRTLLTINVLLQFVKNEGYLQDKKIDVYVITLDSTKKGKDLVDGFIDITDKKLNNIQIKENYNLLTELKDWEDLVGGIANGVNKEIGKLIFSHSNFSNMISAIYKTTVVI